MSTRFTLIGQLPVKHDCGRDFARLLEQLAPLPDEELALEDGYLRVRFDDVDVAVPYVRHVLAALEGFAFAAATAPAVFEHGDRGYVVLGPDRESCRRCEIVLLGERLRELTRRIDELGGLGQASAARPIPPQVRTALAYVRTFSPEVKYVLFGGDGRWQYLDANYQAVAIDDLTYEGVKVLAEAAAAAGSAGLPAAFAC